MASEPGDLDKIDGRRARREANIDLATRVARQLFDEETVFPTVEMVSKRSGLSLRSLYRYFEDIDALLHAAIEQSMAEGFDLMHIHEIGQGDLPLRIERFVASRLRVYERFAASYRASVHNAPTRPEIRAGLERTREVFREQLERHFEPELGQLDPATRLAVASACDAMTQFDSIDLLRRSRGLTFAQTEETLRHALRRLLTQGP